jgi:serine/threonine-protein kinase
MLRNVRNLAVAALVVCGMCVPTTVSADTIDINDYSYAAVAFSPSTGAFHYSFNYGSRAAAVKAALAAHDADDARIVCWVNRGFCALALSADKSCWGTGWTFGDGASNTDAMEFALDDCRERAEGAHIVLCISSDGQYRYVVHQ